MTDHADSEVRRGLDALLTRDGAGGSWLSGLLAAAPRARERLGELVDTPGYLEATVAVRTETGRRGGFEHLAAPGREILAWYVAHPERLARPAGPAPTREAERLRAALLEDQPPGARGPAQARARELMRPGATFSRAWWRFEDTHVLEAALITPRLALVVRTQDDTPATPWFPERSGFVRDLEAARRLAGADKAWGLIEVVADGVAPRDSAQVGALVAAGAPQLDGAAAADLAAGALGSVPLARLTALGGADPVAD